MPKIGSSKISWYGKEGILKITEYNALGITKGRIYMPFNDERGVGVRKYDVELKGTKLGKGNTILKRGSVVRGSVSFYEEVTYRFGGRSRLINGFTTLTTQLRAQGVDPDMCDWLDNMFDSMTDREKVDFFRMYNESTIVKQYGSNAITDTDVATDVHGYADLMVKIIEEIKGVKYA